MDTAWIQVFVLTMSECVAPAGKTVCQEQDVELQFLTQADCQAATEGLLNAFRQRMEVYCTNVTHDPFHRVIAEEAPAANDIRGYFNCCFDGPRGD